MYSIPFYSKNSNILHSGEQMEGCDIISKARCLDNVLSNRMHWLPNVDTRKLVRAVPSASVMHTRISVEIEREHRQKAIALHSEGTIIDAMA